MIAVRARRFSETDHRTWQTILGQHRQQRDNQLCSLFLDGLQTLQLPEDHIPPLEEVNQTLRRCTGFEGIYVDGLEEGARFFPMLADRKFPVGNFIRDSRDLNYTPAPDVVHDIYGHLPFYTDPAYADFCQAFGSAASTYLDRPPLLRQFERFFWFTAEFALVKTPEGLRIFGAGIASSIGECNYALSGKPEVLPFDIDAIRSQEFRIDEMQKRLFCLESPEQLYQSLDSFLNRVAQDAKKAERPAEAP